MTQDDKDKVTVGEIRKILTERLDSHIETLTKLLRGHDVPAAKLVNAHAQIKGEIAKTLEDLDTLNMWAGLPNLIQVLRS